MGNEMSDMCDSETCQLSGPHAKTEVCEAAPPAGFLIRSINTGRWRARDLVEQWTERVPDAYVFATRETASLHSGGHAVVALAEAAGLSPWGKLRDQLEAVLRSSRDPEYYHAVHDVLAAMDQLEREANR